MQTEAQRALMNVLSGAWGTIGPRSLSAARRIAKRVSGRYGLLVHSASAAMEVQLRSLKIGYGDEVIAASYGDPINAMAVACVGATPVFVDIDPETATLSPVAVKNALTGKTRAVIADTPGGNPCDAKALAKICADHGIKLVVNLGDGYNTALHGKPMARYAWGTVLDLSDGCALPAGEGGALVQMD
ncbi:MAG: DegT/DnrJ/EryC1/StrS family aminotransferase, partial [Clostridia bacterium]|nr:DegT/DnrJ/EryC1/StrS family aminotransferase [Clostridia bacterium]